MKMLNRIWKDIRSGENIDLYVTVIAAIVLVILNLVQVVPPSTIAPLTLAVLALLAISILGSRFQIEKLIEHSNRTPRDLFTEKFPETLDNDIMNASELWLLGINLERTLTTHYADFERKVKRGDTLKVLLVSPDGVASEIAATRYYKKIDYAYVQRQIQESLNFLVDLKKIAPEKIEIRTINFPIVFGGYVVNPDKTSGILYLKYYPFKIEGLPNLVLRVQDGHWYDFFMEEIKTLWEYATPFEPKD